MRCPLSDLIGRCWRRCWCRFCERPAHGFAMPAHSPKESKQKRGEMDGLSGSPFSFSLSTVTRFFISFSSDTKHFLFCSCVRVRLFPLPSLPPSFSLSNTAPIHHITPPSSTPSPQRTTAAVSPAPTPRRAATPCTAMGRANPHTAGGL